MKRITQCIITLSICMLVVVNLQASPKVEVLESTFDFGYAPQGSQLTHKYWIHSTGDEDLNILKVVPGCGCTKTPLEKNIVASGDSTWLEIVFSTKQYKNKITKRPKFFTNAETDAQNISFTAEIVAPSVVTSPLVITPFKVNLSKQNVQNDLHLTKSANNKNTVENQSTIEITNSSDIELSITIIAFDNDMFAINLPEKIKAGETVKGNIFLRDVSIEKPFQKSITIEVNDENKTRFTIPVEYNSNTISQK